MKKLLSTILCMAILLSVLSLVPFSANALTKIEGVDLVQKCVILADDAYVYGDSLFLKDDILTDCFDYKLTDSNGYTTTLTYDQIKEYVYAIQYLGDFYVTDAGRYYLNFGNQPVAIIFTTDEYAESYINVSTFDDGLTKGEVVKDNANMSISYYSDGSEGVSYWRIKQSQNNNYGLYSTDWDQVDALTTIFDKNNQIVDPIDEGWNLKGGQEYILRVEYKYNDNCSDIVLFHFLANTDHTHSKTNKTVKKATLAANGSLDYVCSSCSYEAHEIIYRPKTFTLSTVEYDYNGKVKTPKVTVKDYKGKTLKKDTDYTVTYSSGRKNVGEYKVTVKMKGNYSGTKTLTFRIFPQKTSVKSVSGAKRSLKVTINKKTSQVGGYQIQYSTSKNFKGAKTKLLSGAKTVSTTIKGLKAKKTYYIRVRTYKVVGKTRYWSDWSSYKTGKTK